MRNRYPFVIVSSLMGLLLIFISMFAGLIGLDKNPGDWSRGRIALFVFSVMVLLLAYLSYRYQDKLYFLFQKIYIFAENIPLRYLMIPVSVAVICVYIWFGSSGTWTNWKSATFYYDSQARGFMNFDLHLPLEPDPRLLKLPNPYDPAARVGIEFPLDASLYEGKYYIYWGPVPAILLVIIYIFYHGQIGDLFLTLCFICGLFLMQTSLLYFLWKQYFGGLSRFIFLLSIFLVGLAGPLTLLRHNYETARIYEASISGAQFFYISGLLALIKAAHKMPNSNRELAIAGILWAFSIGTRQIVVVPIGFLLIVFSLWVLRFNHWSFKSSKYLLPLGLPIILVCIFLAWFNWARFGSIAETGLYYQLAGWNLRDNYSGFFSQVYIIQNLFNYLFNPIEITAQFPFMFMTAGNEVPFFSFYSLPEMYNAQPIAGLVYTYPFVIFSLLPFWGLTLSKGYQQHVTAVNDQLPLNFVTFALGGSFVLSFGLILSFFWTATRYWGDATPSLMILSIIGFWQGYIYLTSNSLRREWYVKFGVGLASLSILFSSLLALSTNTGLVKFILNLMPF